VTQQLRTLASRFNGFEKTVETVALTPKGLRDTSLKRGANESVLQRNVDVAKEFT
jgi:hypothetical protein